MSNNENHKNPLGSLKTKISANEKNETQKEQKNSEPTQDKNDDKYTKLEEELQKTKDTLLRTLAELDNTRRRTTEELEKTSNYAISGFLKDLIPVMENFYRAFNTIKDNKIDDLKEAENFLEGIKLTHNEFKKAFEKNKITRLYPLNEQFNPDFHNAITQVESDKETNTIIEVMEAGYKLKDRIIKPALVVVSKKKE